MAARINGEQVPLRTELRNGDVVEVITSTVAAPNPAWLGFVTTGRARSKIRHYLKTMAHAESLTLGDKLLAQALRAEGIEHMPAQDAAHQGTWDRLLRFTGSRNRDELLIDIGLGKRVASIVAKRLAVLLAELGEKPDALLMSKERFTAHETVSQGSVVLDGSQNASVKYPQCCHPIPGDAIIGYLGRGEGLVVHTDSCAVGQRLLHKDRERFIGVEWSEEIVRSFEAPLLVTVSNGKGVLARVAAAIAQAEADITLVNMVDEVSGQDAIDLRFVVSVRDLAHLEGVLKNLRRTPSVTQARRVISSRHAEAD
jgi:GTP pyrophosphokinase